MGRLEKNLLAFLSFSFLPPEVFLPPLPEAAIHLFSNRVS